MFQLGRFRSAVSSSSRMTTRGALFISKQCSATSIDYGMYVSRVYQTNPATECSLKSVFMILKPKMGRQAPETILMH